MTQPAKPTDPLQLFRFCPQCGQEGLQVRQVRSLNCPACGFRYFINSATAVGGFIFHGDKIIVAVRGEEPQKGKLDLPGGFVEFDEAADEACGGKFSRSCKSKSRTWPTWARPPTNICSPA